MGVCVCVKLCSKETHSSDSMYPLSLATKAGGQEPVPVVRANEDQTARGWKRPCRGVISIRLLTDQLLRLLQVHVTGKTYLLRTHQFDWILKLEQLAATEKQHEPLSVSQACASPSVPKRYHFSFLHTSTPIQSRAQEDHRAAPNEALYGYLSISSLASWTCLLVTTSQESRLLPGPSGCSCVFKRYLLRTFRFAVIMHDWLRLAVSILIHVSIRQVCVWVLWQS